MFFQIPPMFLVTNGINIIYRVLFIIANIFILLVGQKYHEKREKIRASHLFILLGAINIVWLIIELTLADFIPLLSLSIDEYYAFMLFFIESPGFIINILTFGVILLLIASKNEAYHGNLLTYTAISSIIHAVLAFISTLLLDGSLSMGMNPTGMIVIIIGIINIISLVFLVIFNLFLILYSFRLDELYFKIAATLLLINTLLTILTMILSIFY